MTTYREHFPSIDSVMERLGERRPSDSGNGSRENKAKERWDLSLGYDGAIAAYSGGWAEGASKAYELAETIRMRPTAPRTALSRSVSGGFPNVGAYLAGNPVNMWNVSKREATGHPFVHFYMHISFNGGIRAGTAFDRGCALVALADALESAGCRVKVTGVECSDIKGNYRYCAYHELKDYEDRLDVDNLIFTVAHPAYFRRICFALRERSPDDRIRDRTTSGYGTFCEMTAEDIEDDGVAINIALPGLDSNGGSPERFLLDMVKQLPEEIREWIEGEGE